MANEKYLNLQGLTRVSEYVNEKLRTVTIMPASPNINDIVLYKGASTAEFKQGSIYLYTTIETYYKWSDLSNIYYTKSATPFTGDIVYSDTEGTESGYIVSYYDDENDQVAINSLIYDRDSTGDTPILGWVCRGGTSIILNGKDKTGDIANFYAAPQSGNEGQVLISKGKDEDPEWASYTGYCPNIIDDFLYFNYGVIPEVEDTSIIFDTT